MKNSLEEIKMYNEIVMDHFTNPRNVGVIEDADGIGEVGNVKCGDIMKIYIKVQDETIVDIKFKTFGCGSAIASSSIATEIIKGKTIDEALAITRGASRHWTRARRSRSVSSRHVRSPFNDRRRFRRPRACRPGRPPRGRRGRRSGSRRRPGCRFAGKAAGRGNPCLRRG